MRSVYIEIENIELAELEIDQPVTYALLKFAQSQLTGYWVNKRYNTITFYLGAQTFICANNEKNLELFESILNSRI